MEHNSYRSFRCWSCSAYSIGIYCIFCKEKKLEYEIIKTPIKISRKENIIIKVKRKLIPALFFGVRL